MSYKNNNTISISISGFSSFLLFLLFLGLKLGKVITWSWWWVTAPLWGPIALGIAISIIAFIIGIFVGFIKVIRNN